MCPKQRSQQSFEFGAPNPEAHSSLQAKTAADEGYGGRGPGVLQPRGRSPTGLPSLRDGIALLQREEQAAPWPA